MTFVGSWTLTFAPNQYDFINFPIVLSTAATTLTVVLTDIHDVAFQADISARGTASSAASSATPSMRPATTSR